ncbi:MAG: RsmE family RNA methyltransferase [Acidimicrobiales bacterium]
MDDVALDAKDAYHLKHVLRLRNGEVVSVTDGGGRWRQGRWSGQTVDVDGPVSVEARAEPSITIGFAPVKGDRPAWTVQKLTELGVDRIVIFASGRSVVRWEGAKAEAQLARLRRVAREACAQSRRCWLPVIEASRGLPDGALAHFDGAVLSLDHPSVLVGPEGGWSDEELAGRQLVALGPGVLRAETAAIAAAAILSTQRAARN